MSESRILARERGVGAEARRIKSGLYSEGRQVSKRKEKASKKISLKDVGESMSE